MAKKLNGGESLPNRLTDKWLGLNTAIQNSADLPRGMSPDELNWMVSIAGLTSSPAQQQGGGSPTPAAVIGDHIELRRGTALLGQTTNGAATPISGLGVAIGTDGTQVPFYSFGTSLWYYDGTTKDVADTTTALPVGSLNDDVCIAGYTNIAGAFCYVSSPNMGKVLKIPVANPTSSVTLSPGQSGYFIFDQSRSFMWNTLLPASGLKNKNNVYISYTDASSYSANPPFTVKQNLTIGTGDGTTKTYTGNLKTLGTVGAGLTVFGVQFGGASAAPVAISAITAALQAAITTSSAHGLIAGQSFIIYGAGGMTQINDLILQVAAVQGTTAFTVNLDSLGFTPYTSGGDVAAAEVFTDNLNGTLTGSAGGTGTINYATGAYSITFNAAPANTADITANFLTEDSVNGSVFDYTVPSSRTNGQALIELQASSGGQIQTIVPLSGTDYCMHLYDVWQLFLSADDTKASNVIYRQNVGIPNWRAAQATGTGIIILDNFTSAIPRVRSLSIEYTITSLNPLVIPVAISDNLDLSPYTFDKCVIVFWGHYYLVFVKGQTNGKPDPKNDVSFIYNTMSGSWDKLDYAATCAAVYLGTLIVGDTLSPNVYTLFSGFDDLNEVINNFYTSAPDKFDVPGQKRFNKFRVKGLINTSQSIDVYFSYDGAPYTKSYTISGSGEYVNKGQPTAIGGYTLGSQIYGGAATQFAYPFEVEFSVGSPRFEYVSYKIVATDVGYAGIYEMEYKDVRYKGLRSISTADVSPVP